MTHTTEVTDAVRMAVAALAGDSNDTEHDALLALVEALKIEKYRTFVVFGEPSTLKEHSTAYEYWFDTADELAAFLYGLDEGSGWMDVSPYDTEAEAKEYIQSIVSEDAE